MDFKIAVLFASAIVNISLGLVVWVRGALDLIRKVFVVFSIATSFWAFGLAMFFLNSDPQTTLFWGKFLYFAGSMIAVSLCYFSFIFPSPYLKKDFMTVIQFTIAIFSLGIFYLTFATDLVLTGVLEGPHKGLAFGWGYQFWLFHFLSLMVLAFINLFIQHRRSIRTERLQVRYILIGTLSAAVFGSSTNVILPTLGNFNYFAIGPLLSISMVGFIAYAIIKHRLMDIRLVIARTIAYSLLVTIIGTFYVAASFILSSLFLGFAAGKSQLLTYTILTLIAALSFDRLRQILERVTDRFFFKAHYDSNQLLSSLASVMSTNIELQPLSSSLLEILRKEIRITRAALILLGKDSIYDVMAVGFAQASHFSYPQLQLLLTQEKVVYFDELAEGNTKQLMRELNITISTILRVKDKTVGLLILGEKASGEMYSDQDLKVLNILAPEMAVAIQNAQSFDQIKKFNITLSEEIKKATTDLQKANTRLEELDKLKDDFVSVASHELRTPMTAIRSYSWMALNRPDITLSEKMKKYLSRTLISTERLINLVNDMLNVSRIEAGRIEIRPQIFDIQTLVDDVIAEVIPKASEKMVRLEAVKSTMPRVFADPDKVHQVLLNLIGNALKFTPVDGLIKVNFFSDGKMIEISVVDNGVGISKEDLSRLFQKFGRLDNSYVAAATSGGTGLGLYISKSLVELMHGVIKVSSEGIGKGATFTFSLPVATPEIVVQSDKFTKKPIGEAKVLEPVAI